jgi:hypothetical protein
MFEIVFTILAIIFWIAASRAFFRGMDAMIALACKMDHGHGTPPHPHARIKCFCPCHMSQKQKVKP